MYAETFSQRLKRAREEIGYTQVQVSDILNIPRVNISNYETARTQPDIETLGLLIDLYEEDANIIIGTRGKKRE